MMYSNCCCWFCWWCVVIVVSALWLMLLLLLLLLYEYCCLWCSMMLLLLLLLQLLLLMLCYYCFCWYYMKIVVDCVAFYTRFQCCIIVAHGCQCNSIIVIGYVVWYLLLSMAYEYWSCKCYMNFVIVNDLLLMLMLVLYDYCYYSQNLDSFCIMYCAWAPQYCLISLAETLTIKITFCKLSH